MKSNYLNTLQAIANGLEIIGRPVDEQQAKVIADVLAKQDDLNATIDAQMAVIDQQRRMRLDRRLGDRRQQDLPVAVERRAADRRGGQDRREADMARAHIDNGAGDA